MDTTIEKQTAYLHMRIGELFLAYPKETVHMARMISKLIIVPTDAIEYTATDGRRLYMNESYIRQIEDPELFYILSHEMLHIALDHMELGKVLDPGKSNGQLLNICMDLEIESLLKNLKQPVVAEICTCTDFNVPMAKGTVWYWNHFPSNTDTSAQRSTCMVPGAEGDEDLSPIFTDSDIESVLKSFGVTSNTEVMDIKNDIFNSSIIVRILKMVRNHRYTEYNKRWQSPRDQAFFGRRQSKIRKTKYAVYVDISGSMLTYYKYFNSFITQMSKNDVVYAGMFNTELFDYNPTVFNGGTDIQCVVNDAKARDVVPIIFTDGYYNTVELDPRTVFVLTADHDKHQTYTQNKYVLKLTKKGLK